MRSVFRAYGLRIGANLRIPGVIADPNGSNLDLRVRFGPLPGGSSGAFKNRFGEHTAFEDDEPVRPESLSQIPDGGPGFALRYDDGTAFIVDAAGTRVWAAWPDSSTLEDTVVYLLGPVLALVLRLRGVTCLHASAFSVNGHAVALVGPSGAGKSTTAAALAGRGLAVLTDDLMALEERRDSIVAYPGYPRLRLWPEAVNLLYGVPDALPPLTPNWDKRYLDLQTRPRSFEQQSLPLTAIYLLGGQCEDPTGPVVERLTPGNALLSLLANSRGDAYLDKRSLRRDFRLLGKAVRRIPVYRVSSGANSRPLATLCDAIMENLQSSSNRMDGDNRQACTI